MYLPVDYISESNPDLKLSKKKHRRIFCSYFRIPSLVQRLFYDRIDWDVTMRSPPLPSSALIYGFYGTLWKLLVEQFSWLFGFILLSLCWWYLLYFHVRTKRIHCRLCPPVSITIPVRWLYLKQFTLDYDEWWWGSLGLKNLLLLELGNQAFFFVYCHVFSFFLQFCYSFGLKLSIFY